MTWENHHHERIAAAKRPRNDVDYNVIARSAAARRSPLLDMIDKISRNFNSGVYKDKEEIATAQSASQ